MPNRLADETSPYLLQHRDNPVDWFPWGEEAFARAAKESKPIFLSVGYSSCHWCHVMEHESFEDEGVAEVLNKHFISVKVDREERPDVDEAYMTAVQLSSGRGGWPMSVFMTPDRKPFFAGTYFPKDKFIQVATQVAGAWETGRKDLTEAAKEFSTALAEVLTKPAPGTFTKFDEAFLERSIQAIASEFDAKNGGFGEAPKFPPHGALELLMSYALRPQSKEELREAALGIALATLERMCRGGIRDHVGGGFHRYSTDERWLLPHFEKMLYDNALMLGNLVHASAIASQIDPALEALFTDAAQDLMAWLGTEMMAPDGLFYSAIDADSEGEEGVFYLWTMDQVEEVLGTKAAAFAKAFGLEKGGNFQDEATGKTTGRNIPYLLDPAADFQEDLKALKMARDQRPKPALDFKAIVAWNGLMISSLVDAGRIPEAERAADAILQAEKSHGQLPHQISQRTPAGAAFLDDYAAFVDGLIKLGSTLELMAQLKAESPAEYAQLGLAGGQFEGRHWLREAARLAKSMVEKFYDEEKGAFFATAKDHEVLFGRTKPVFDQPIPSGNALAVKCLLALGDVERAAQSIECLLGWMERAPHATEALLLAALPMIGESAAEEAPAIIKAPPADVVIKMSARELQADSKGWASAEVTLSIPEGFHINSPEPPARWLIPTTLEIQPLKFKVDYPEAPDYSYVGEVRIPFQVEMPPSESAAEFEVKITYQACTDTECLEAKERKIDCVLLR